MKDIYGKALLDYWNNNYTEDIFTTSNITEKDALPLPHLFRDFKSMPLLEQKALNLAKGKVLDIGAGAGSHSVYLQEKGLDVTALDLSKGAIEVCENRGIKKTICSDIFDFKNEKFDTILLLMNGAGLCGTLNRMGDFLKHLKSLLSPNGQILTDSSDIIYMYEDENGEYWIDASDKYYGELKFQMHYLVYSTPIFEWLYIDYNTLQRAAHINGLESKLISEGEHYDYLAQLYQI